MAVRRKASKSASSQSAPTEGDLLAHRERLESIGRLSSGLVHDFNNLLTVVYTYCALLERCVRDDATAQGYVEQIEAAVQRGSELSRNVLDFARPSTPGTRCVDVNEVVLRIGGMLERLLGESIEVRTATERSIQVVRGDIAQLEQVLINLALNAKDAMSDGGVLSIRTSTVVLDEADAAALGLRRGEHVLLSVADTGHGMDDATASRIFEPFFTTKGGNGTGLGLATTREAVRAAKGAITVESTLGVGTTFRIWLPVTADRTAAPRSFTTSRPPRATRYAILLVETNASIRAPLAEYLRLRGFDVLEAADGSQAMRHTQQSTRPLHVLVADPAAPRMRDRGVTETIRTLCPDMKTLYVLREADTAALERLPAEPGALVLEKPFSPDVLVSHILQLLENTPISDSEPRSLAGD